MKIGSRTLFLVGVVFFAVFAAFWVSGARAQDLVVRLKHQDGPGLAGNGSTGSASIEGRPEGSIKVTYSAPTMIAKVGMVAPGPGKVLVIADATFQPATVEWASLRVKLAQGAEVVDLPIGHDTFNGSEGTNYFSVPFSTIYTIPHGGPWEVQLWVHTVSAVKVHTFHCSAVYIGR